MNKSKQFEREGLEFLNKGNDQKALECFGKAVSLDHLNYQALRNLLLTAHRLGLTPDATIVIRDLIQEYPSDAHMLTIAREYTDLVQGKAMAMAPLTTIFPSKDRPMQAPHGYSNFKKLLELMPFDNPYDNFNFNAVPQDISGGGGDRVFDKYLEEIDVHLIVEVGSWKGASAVYFGSHLKERNIDGVVICIDTWLGTINNMIEYNDPIWGLRKYYVNGYPRLYTQFLANVSHRGLQNYIVPFPNTSSIGAKWLKHHSILADFIYIDGSHEEEDVYKDVLDYWPIVRPKGFLTGDDWHSGGEGIKNAVTRFVKEHNLHLDIAGTKWIIRKA